MSENIEQRSLMIHFCAQMAHEANRLYCLSIDDNSQPEWANAPQWQVDSAKEGVRALLANPEITPEQLHQNWCAHKRSEGWVHGPVKDPRKKTHPCLVPYDELPETQRRKDELFRGTVFAFAKAVGLL